jgi:hypothetical protein
VKLDEKDEVGEELGCDVGVELLLLELNEEEDDIEAKFGHSRAERRRERDREDEEKWELSGPTNFLESYGSETLWYIL